MDKFKEYSFTTTSKDSTLGYYVKRNKLYITEENNLGIVHHFMGLVTNPFPYAVEMKNKTLNLKFTQFHRLKDAGDTNLSRLYPNGAIVKRVTSTGTRVVVANYSHSTVEVVNVDIWGDVQFEHLQPASRQEIEKYRPELINLI